LTWGAGHGQPLEHDVAGLLPAAEDEDRWYLVASAEVGGVEDLAKQLVAVTWRVVEVSPGLFVVAVVDETTSIVLERIRPELIHEIRVQNDEPNSEWIECAFETDTTAVAATFKLGDRIVYDISSVATSIYSAQLETTVW